MVVETFKFVMLRTQGFIALPEELQAKIMYHAVKHIRPKPDFIVYKAKPVETHLEDEGRTLITYIPDTPEKVYAKLDDFGDPAEWDQMYEPEIAESLRKAPNCRYTVTFMLAEER